MQLFCFIALIGIALADGNSTSVAHGPDGPPITTVQTTSTNNPPPPNPVATSNAPSPAITSQAPQQNTVGGSPQSSQVSVGPSGQTAFVYTPNHNAARMPQIFEAIAAIILQLFV